jgi:hypothetical protein
MSMILLCKEQFGRKSNKLLIILTGVHNKQLGMIIGEKIKTAKLRLVYIPQIHLTAEL